MAFILKNPTIFLSSITSQFPGREALTLSKTDSKRSIGRRNILILKTFSYIENPRNHKAWEPYSVHRKTSRMEDMKADLMYTKYLSASLKTSRGTWSGSWNHCHPFHYDEFPFSYLSIQGYVGWIFALKIVSPRLFCRSCLVWCKC